MVGVFPDPDALLRLAGAVLFCAHDEWQVSTAPGYTSKADLPPVRLHDLRHGAASLTYPATMAVQTLLGHSQISITADTYTSLFEGAERETAPRQRWCRASARCSQCVPTGRRK